MKKVFLLADDDADDVEMFHEALREIDSSITLYTAWDGKDALEKLNNKDLEQPQIIFLDINMPGMNGWQCLTILKSHVLFRHIPVIVYSTSSHQRNTDIALDLGALCFFTKPSDFSELKSILEVLMSNLNSDLLGAISKFNAIKF